MKNNFTETYLKLLNEEVDNKEDVTTECGDNSVSNTTSSDEEIVQNSEECPECGKNPCECESVEDDAAQGEVEPAADDAAASEEDPTGEEGQDDAICFCFKTTNKDLIDAINSGFDKVTFTVSAKDEETGEDTTTDVEFSSADFQDFSECDCDEDEDTEEGACPVCGKDPCECQDDSEDDISFDGANSFESVFEKYYKKLV